MECVLSATRFREFSRALLCLSKIGADLIVETTSNRMILRTLGMSQSVYAHFCFKRDYFDSFRHSHPHTFVKCKLGLKSLLSAFGNPSLVRHAVLVFKTDANVLKVSISHKNGIKRVWSFPYHAQVNVLQADFQRDSCGNTVVVEPTVLARVLSHFDPSLKEATFVSTPDNLKVVSFVDEAASVGEGKSRAAVLRTEWTMSANEFEVFDVENRTTEVTFCIKELKSMITLCESIGDSMFFMFDRGGKPIMISNADDNSQAPLVAEIVIATLQDDNDQEEPEAEYAPAASQQQQQQESYSQQSHPNGTPSHGGSQSSYRFDNDIHPASSSSYAAPSAAFSPHTPHNGSAHRVQAAQSPSSSMLTEHPSSNVRKRSHANSSSSSSVNHNMASLSQASSASTYSFDILPPQSTAGSAFGSPMNKRARHHEEGKF